jgi:molybdenum cofactor biosynthesis enzyme MoaA
MSLAKTFCSAPWFQTRIDWDGNYRPCCELNETYSQFEGQTQYSLTDTTVDQYMSSEYSQYLRKNLSEGIPLPECSSCWKKEKNNVESLRQKINNTVSNNQGHDLDNTWVKLFIKRSKHYKDYRLVSADVKLSNVCNFSCAMCSPQDSSKIYDKWKSDLDNKFVKQILQKRPTYFTDILSIYQTQRGYQHLIDILAHPIKHLKVLGGEPLLDKELFNILQNQSVDKKSQIHVHMVTNGSQDLVEAWNKLKDYKSVSFTVSLEGIGDMQDYVRQGSNWSTVEKNVLNAHQQGILININHTIQAMSALNLSELLLWCHNSKISISFGVLESPDYLSLSVLTSDIRQMIIDNLSEIKHINVINSLDNSSLLSIKNIIELINNFPSYTDQYITFLEYVEWFERNSIKKLQHIQPAFYAG